MLKKYKAKSCVSVNVTLSTGGNTHISFSAITGGGSVYYTKNPIIQQGLESHPKYGKLFTLESSTPSRSNKEAPAAKPNGAPAGSNANAGTKAPQVKEVKAACNDDAKDYLVERFGISRTKLRNREQIEAAGTANGVKFIWK